MTVTVDQSKLVMNAFAAIFENELITADLVTWKQYDTELNDRNRLNVSEQVGPRYDVTETVNGVANLTTGVQDTVFGSEQFTVNRTFGSSMGWDDFVKIRDIGDARESAAIKGAATSLAHKIDGYVMREVVNGASGWVGTPGVDVSTYTDFVSGYTRLKEQGVDDSDLRGALTFNDKQALGANVVDIDGIDSMSATTYRSGFSGSIGGIPTMFTQQLPTLTTGTRTNGALNAANQNVNYSAVSVSPAPGQYLTQTISLNGVGTTATVSAGEVFTIAGVYAYDNRLGAVLPHLQQFTVVESATAVGGVIAALRIFPAIIVPNTGGGTEAAVNTAHATVGSVPGATAAVTFLGTASTGYKARAIIQKEAFIVNTAPLILPATGKGLRKGLDRVPLQVRMWQNSDFNTGFHGVRFDVALTGNWRDRRRAIRINGS